jgi:cytochrome P450
MATGAGQLNVREMLARLPPGSRWPPAIQFLAIWTRPGGAVMRLRRRYGTRFTSRLPFQLPFVVLSDPEQIRELFLASPEDVHPGEGAWILEPVVGRYSLILLDEALHLEHRRLLLPAFHGERMHRLAGLMATLTAEEMSSWPVDEPVELHPRLQRLTLEIILRAVFGLSVGERLDGLRASLAQVLSFAESPISLLLPSLQRRAPWLPSLRRLERALAATDALIFEQVAARRTLLARGEGLDEPDVLTMLLQARHEDGSLMEDQELRDELMTALVAGHETTASQLSFAFVHLARAPEVVERLRAEAESGSDDSYLTATVNEILRLRPVLPNAEPRLAKVPITIGGWEYPVGTSLVASSYLVHHDPEIYPDPFAFRPERFLGLTPGTYTWIPFGGGRRRCLGAAFAVQELKLVLAEAVRRFDLAAVEPRVERARRRSVTVSPDRRATVILKCRFLGYQSPDALALEDAPPV